MGQAKHIFRCLFAASWCLPAAFVFSDSTMSIDQVLTGDMLLAAAFVSYAGPFTSRFRSSLITNWIKFIVDKGAPMTPGITDPLKVWGE